MSDPITEEAVTAGVPGHVWDTLAAGPASLAEVVKAVTPGDPADPAQDPAWKVTGLIQRCVEAALPHLADQPATTGDDDLHHRLTQRTQDCIRVREALLPMLSEHPVTRDDVAGIDPTKVRAGYLGKTAADLLRWYADELDRRQYADRGTETAALRAEADRLRTALDAVWDLVEEAVRIIKTALRGGE